MALVSQTEFAKMTGRTRQAISQRTKRGSLVATASGKIDTKNPINAQFLMEIEEERAITNPPEIKKTPPGESKENPDHPAQSKQEPNPPNALMKNAASAKQGQEVLKYKKLELELKALQGELIRRDLVADVCFGYLSALNINIMEFPQSFLDELEGAIINKSTRSTKMEIVTRPICEAITQAISQIEKTLRATDEN